jgi:hypothetical protein
LFDGYSDLILNIDEYWLLGLYAILDYVVPGRNPDDIAAARMLLHFCICQFNIRGAPGGQELSGDEHDQPQPRPGPSDEPRPAGGSSGTVQPVVAQVGAQV